MNELLRSELIRDEGLRLEVYRDTVGLCTIGVGHLLGTTPRMRSITEQEAYALLEYDARIAEGIAARVFGPLDFDMPRGRVLVNLCFNLGNKIMDFKHLIAAVKVEDWEAAAKAMEDSKWYGQVGARGPRLAAVMRTGEAA